MFRLKDWGLGTNFWKQLALERFELISTHWTLGERQQGDPLDRRDRAKDAQLREAPDSETALGRYQEIE